MFYVVAYDIPNDKRRNRLFKSLKGYGIRNQFSLFECHLDSEKYNRMLKVVSRIINAKEDNVKIYFICKDCFKKIKALGCSTVTMDNNVTIV
ncbi:MAG: CRISPR-associated endonuclease Cas2 [Actinobacteria bacterium]|nr:CRISPR-associated endonuclease Cas2 [Actinomycetota bacterium]